MRCPHCNLLIADTLHAYRMHVRFKHPGVPEPMGRVNTPKPENPLRETYVTANRAVPIPSQKRVKRDLQHKAREKARNERLKQGILFYGGGYVDATVARQLAATQDRKPTDDH